MVAFSMLIIALVVVGVLVGAHLDSRPLIIGGAVVGSWVLAYFLGMVFGQAQGYNDNIEADIAASNRWNWGYQARQDAATEIIGLGCLLAVLQFAFGGIYTGINALFFSPSGSGDKLRLSTAIITLLYNEPQEKFPLEKISQSLQTAGLPTPPKPLQKTLQALIAKNLIHGNPDLGYGCNPSQVERFL
jgi:hypothetical protein